MDGEVVDGGGEPMRRLWRLADLVTPMALRVAATLRVADGLAPGPRRARELAEAADVDAGARERVLRHLAAVGVLSRDGSGRYGLTPLGEGLRDDHPSGIRARLDIPRGPVATCSRPSSTTGATTRPSPSCGAAGRPPGRAAPYWSWRRRARAASHPGPTPTSGCSPTWGAGSAV